MKAVRRLDEVCEVVMGQAPSGEAYNTDGKGWPLIAGAGDFGATAPLAKKFTTEASKLSRDGDIVLGIRASIGEKVVADGEYCLGRGVAGLRARDSLDSRFLWHWLTDSAPRLVAKARGATFKQVNREDIGELEIDLPPLVEQRRIAEVLDLADALRAKRRAALAQLDSLSQSLFADPLANPKGVKVVRLADVTTRITDGIHLKPTYTESGIPFISVKDITTGKLVFDDCKFISAEDHERFTKRCKPERLDILYTKVGATYGRPAIVETDREFSIYVSVCLIKPRKEIVDPYFLTAALASSAVKKQADRRIKGIGVPDLHLDQIQSFLIPLPSLSQQREFARRLRAVEKLKTAQRASLAELDALFAWLQHRAFRGELS